LAFSKILLLALMLALIPTAVVLVEAKPHSASEGLSKVTIDASGQAFPIPVMGGPPCNGTGVSASVHLVGDVRHKNSPALISYENLTGTVTVDRTTYNVVSGSGIYNLRSQLVELQGVFMNQAQPNLLILHGNAGSGHTEGSGGIPVNFPCPQSKLTATWFLQLDGTITLA
jgi:hypothetical protein